MKIYPKKTLWVVLKLLKGVRWLRLILITSATLYYAYDPIIFIL